MRRGGGAVPISIGSRALDVFYVLVERHGCFVSKDELTTAVWPGTVVEEANPTIQISTLRRDTNWSQTEAARGCRFVQSVTRLVPRASSPETTPTVSESDGASERPTPKWHRFKFVAVVLLAIGIAAAGWIAARMGPGGGFRSDAVRPRLSIVVLPSLTLSNDP